MYECLRLLRQLALTCVQVLAKALKIRCPLLEWPGGPFYTLNLRGENKEFRRELEQDLFVRVCIKIIKMWVK